jgi:hypothetical protein
MSLRAQREASSIEVACWLEENVPVLSSHQAEAIRGLLARQGQFIFYVEKEKCDSIYLRLTIVIWVFVWACLIITLPINFIFTGRWGYAGIEWFHSWSTKLGLY